jgi:hypothetical protein
MRCRVGTSHRTTHDAKAEKTEITVVCDTVTQGTTRIVIDSPLAVIPSDIKQGCLELDDCARVEPWFIVPAHVETQTPDDPSHHYGRVQRHRIVLVHDFGLSWSREPRLTSQSLRMRTNTSQKSQIDWICISDEAVSAPKNVMVIEPVESLQQPKENDSRLASESYTSGQHTNSGTTSDQRKGSFHPFRVICYSLR